MCIRDSPMTLKNAALGHPLGFPLTLSLQHYNSRNITLKHNNSRNILIELQMDFSIRASY